MVIILLDLCCSYSDHDCDPDSDPDRDHDRDRDHDSDRNSDECTVGYII